MKLMLGILIVANLYMAYQNERMRQECRQAISDVALINSAMLGRAYTAERCALSSLEQVEADIADRDGMTVEQKSAIKGKAKISRAMKVDSLTRNR